MKVEFSYSARQYIGNEASYLRKRNPAAAARFRARLTSLAQQLSQFPRSGFLLKVFRTQETFRIVAGDYVVDYEIAPAGVTVLTIRHGRQAETDAAIEDDQDFEA